jgi:hypothetical protein
MHTGHAGYLRFRAVFRPAGMAAELPGLAYVAASP